MKKNVTLIAIFIFLCYPLFAQDASIDLLFTGDNNGDHVTLDSIYLKNLTQGGDVMLLPPDTTFSLLYVGLNEVPANLKGSLSLSQNFPNPFKERTEFNLFMGKSGMLEIKVFNLLGKQVLEFQSMLGQGSHSFSFTSGGEKVYLISASAFGITRNIKLFCTTKVKVNCELNHLGRGFPTDNFKSERLSKDFPYELGDVLLFVGYHALGESGMLDSPAESTTYTFQFATNIPCIESPTVDYEGQIYNTIQIFSQCWFKENLNVGTMINAPVPQLDNNEIEKYCLVNDPAECESYGGIYMWEELMQYTMEEGTQGICPPGWHVPSDADWKVLEGAVDSHYGVGDQVWDLTYERGFDAGKNLKSTSGWYSGGNGTDMFGFTSISGGFYYSGMGWAGGSLFGPFYTSSHVVVGTTSKPCHRGLSWVWNQISREFDLKEHARPIRCLKDIY